jgi:hypothetical protein
MIDFIGRALEKTENLNSVMDVLGRETTSFRSIRKDESKHAQMELKQERVLQDAQINKKPR